MFKKIRNLIRKPIVNHRIKIGRYQPVKEGENAYLDLKQGGILVKGYYDKPFRHKTEVLRNNEQQISNFDIDFVEGNPDVKEQN